MTLTLEISPELEEALCKIAERHGLPPDQYVLDALQERLERDQQLPPHLPRGEARLLKQIQQGLPEGTWRRYHELVGKREREELTDSEQAELVTLADAVEGWNVRRLELAHELAKLRRVPWESIIEELHLVSRTHA